MGYGEDHDNPGNEYMQRLMECNKCLYIGDLSHLPGDIDTSDMSQDEAVEYIKREFPKCREMFHLIGWTTPRDGFDLCPKCSEDHIKETAH
jgi:hypothetical protein